MIVNSSAELFFSTDTKLVSANTEKNNSLSFQDCMKEKVTNSQSTNNKDTLKSNVEKNDYKRDSYKNSLSRMKKTEQNENSQSKEISKDDLEKMSNELKDKIMTRLSISDAELEDIMCVLNLSWADLLNPDKLQMLVLGCEGKGQVDLLTDENLNQCLQSIFSDLNEILNNYGIDFEQLNSCVQALDDVDFEEVLAETLDGAVGENEIIAFNVESEAKVTYVEAEIRADSIETEIKTVNAETKVEADSNETEIKTVNVETKVEAGSNETEIKRANAETKVKADSIETEIKTVNAKTKVKVDSIETEIKTANAETKVEAGGIETEIKTTDDEVVQTGIVQESQDAKRSDNASSKEEQSFSGREKEEKALKIENVEIGQQVTTIDVQHDFQRIVTTIRETDSHGVASQVITQIKVMVSEDINSLQLQLYPEHLGRLSIDISEKSGVMSAQLIVESEDAKQALVSSMNELKDAFQVQNIKVSEIVVSVAPESFGQQEQSSKEQLADSKKTGKLGVRNLKLDALLDDEVEELMEEEKIAVEMMQLNGNSVDFIA